MAARGEKGHAEQSPAEQMVQQLLDQTGLDPAALARMMLDQLGASNIAAGATRQPPSFTIADPPTEPTIVRLKVELIGVEPAIWRRLDVRGGVTMDQFHDILQIAMGWTDSHLHRFSMGTEARDWDAPHLVSRFDEEEDEDDGGVAFEDEVRVDQLLRGPNDRLFYAYDFGDGWQHSVTVELIRPATDDDPRAICRSGKRAGPLEDCGGTGGHAEIVELLATSPDRSAWREELVHWVPDGWDPDHFDAAEVNAQLEASEPDLERLAVYHPAIVEIAVRLHPQSRVRFGPLLDLALAPISTPPNELEVRAAVRPWQQLLSHAGEEGIPLTAAGWMRPADVEQLAAELGMDGWWPGRNWREDLTRPLAKLRENAMQLRLLRKYKGRLRRTPLGQTVDGNPQMLWSLVAHSVLPPIVGGAADFESDVALAILLQVAAGCPAGDDTEAVLVDMLGAFGWSAGWDPIDPMQLYPTGWGAADVMGWIGSADGREIPTRPTPVQQAFAKTALGVHD